MCVKSPNPTVYPSRTLFRLRLMFHPRLCLEGGEPDVHNLCVKFDRPDYELDVRIFALRCKIVEFGPKFR